MDSVVWCDLEKVIHTTDEAVRVKLLNEDEPRWIPKKCIEDMNDEQIGVKQWFAEKEGIEGDW